MSSESRLSGLLSDLGTESLVRADSWLLAANPEAHAYTRESSAGPNAPRSLAPREAAHARAIESRSYDANRATHLRKPEPFTNRMNDPLENILGT